MSLPDKLKKALDRDGALDIGGVVEGAEAFVLADVARHRAKKRPLVFVMRDGSRMPEIEELNIGHSIVSHAIFVGFERAVAELARPIASRETS